ncbi:hypothetical protein TNCT_171821 [Trichonephila clavata]|uniref:Uncharacterized protein n=1 Tax=Trichonephila clavata TaxID=2740835 RepID=A0A8X6FID4_TRICU|nr:hypothetical protein TNCT_171821 [Trichonephila clavata]
MQWVILRGGVLEHQAAKPLMVAARLVRFSGTIPDDEERMPVTEKSIYRFLSNPPSVDIDHFSNSTFRTVVNGHAVSGC